MSETLFTDKELRRRVRRVVRALEHARRRIVIPEGPRVPGVRIPTQRERDREDARALLLNCAKIAEGRAALFHDKRRGAPKVLKCPRQTIAGYSCIIERCELCGGEGQVAVALLVAHYAKVARELAELARGRR